MHNPKHISVKVIGHGSVTLPFETESRFLDEARATIAAKLRFVEATLQHIGPHNRFVFALPRGFATERSSAGTQHNTAPQKRNTA